MILDLCDSYYLQIQKQMKIINPGQMFGGVIQSRDWPASPPLASTLYLLFLSSQAIGGSESQNLFELTLQWSWVTIGTDIQPNQQAANRGDRYRTSLMIMSNLRSANYPSYCPKRTIAGVDAEGDLTVNSINQLAVGGAESIWWSKLTMMPKQDNAKSGFVYGAASVRVYGWDDVLASVA
jgi:hypothetical protein